MRRARLPARHGTPVVPADLADHRCLSHTVWTARNEWTLPGAQDTVRWKRDAILRCNDGYGLRMAAIAGAGLLLQPEVLLSEALASGKLVRVLEAYTPSASGTFTLASGSSPAAEAGPLRRACAERGKTLFMNGG